VDVPIYDFKVHNRSSETTKVGPVDVVILEGLFSYYDKEIDEMANLKVYVDTPNDERLLRRMIRDIKERGRDLDGVAKQ
jgi:uridine kinase